MTSIRILLFHTLVLFFTIFSSNIAHAFPTFEKIYQQRVFRFFDLHPDKKGIHQGLYIDRLSLQKKFKSDQELSDKIQTFDSSLANSYLTSTYSSNTIEYWHDLQLGYGYSNARGFRYLQTQGYGHTQYKGIQGLQSDRGNWGFLKYSADVNVADFFQITSRTYFRPRQHHLSVENDSLFFIEQLSAGFTLRNLRIQGGKIPTTWGVGKLNHFLFAAENQAPWEIRLSSLDSYSMPSFLEFLGETRWELFYAFFDKNQQIPDPHVIGLNFSFMPISNMEFTLGQIFMFGGNGAAQNPLLFFSEKLVDTGNVNPNRNYLLSFRYQLQELGIEPYFELMGEDCCDPKILRLLHPRHFMNLVGIHFQKVGSEKIDATFEWMRTNHITYRHGTYSHGLIYKNRLLGATLGPDGTGVYGRIRFFPNEKYYFEGLFSYEVRGKLGEATSSGPEIPIETVEPEFEFPEQRNTMEINFFSHLSKNFDLIVGAGVEHVIHENYKKFTSDTHFLSTLQLRYTFD
ncbi:MAG: capsule assembly Wzi family protein [Bdellovibrionota bacterium]